MPRLLKNVPRNKDREHFPVIDRGEPRQPAFVRYRCIKNLEASLCSIKENFSLEKIEAAMPYAWGD
jgi:hypothetical protein